MANLLALLLGFRQLQSCFAERAGAALSIWHCVLSPGELGQLHLELGRKWGIRQGDAGAAAGPTKIAYSFLYYICPATAGVMVG